MLNLFNQTKIWFITSVFGVIAASAQQNANQSNKQVPYEQRQEMSSCQTMPSYSAPASFGVGNSWNIYTTGSFIYWQASQENIEIGAVSEDDPENKIASASILGPYPFGTSYVNNMKITSPNFTFRPGFKFGLGANLNWDGWDAYAEYTWFHGSIGSGVRPLTPSTATSGTPNGQYLYPIQGTPSSVAFFFRNADQSWSIKMDLLDLSLARAHYSGTKLTIRSFFGARGALIRQHLSTFYIGSSEYTEDGEGYHNLSTWNDSTSWGVGPRAGVESNWMLGAGFRLIGNGSADILYTRYSLRFNQQISQFAGIVNPVDGPISSNASVSQKIDYLRPHLDLEMGFGWGTHLRNNAYHFDLSATYNFQVFWDQNMFFCFVESSLPGKKINPNGNLYIQGLTLNARFDF